MLLPISNGKVLMTTKGTHIYELEEEWISASYCGLQPQSYDPYLDRVLLEDASAIFQDGVGKDAYGELCSHKQLAAAKQQICEAVAKLGEVFGVVAARKYIADLAKSC